VVPRVAPLKVAEVTQLELEAEPPCYVGMLCEAASCDASYRQKLVSVYSQLCAN